MKIAILGIFALIFIFLAVMLFSRGIFWFVYPDKSKYPIRGIDISHHQGDITWSDIEFNTYSFVFMKATEGTTFIDPLFQKNMTEATNTTLYVGAYHYFTFADSGREQALHFIANVHKELISLPPVIDLEFMEYSDTGPDYKRFNEELSSFIKLIRNYYGEDPIIYTTYEFMENYLINTFTEYDYWIRDLLRAPDLDDRSISFWQFKNRGQINGIDGYVDINVFNGNQLDFEKYTSMIFRNTRH